MSVSDQPDAPRRFLASCSIYSPRWAALTGRKGTISLQIVFWAIVAVVVLWAVGPMFGVHHPFRPFRVPGRLLAYGWPALLVVFGLVVGANFAWRWRRTYAITVTGDGLAIDGNVYSFADAQLGLWAGTGLVLHLQRGRRRFLLGGRDCPIGPATPLGAAPVPLVDAWLSESDFDAVVSLSGRWPNPAAAHQGSSRCVLFPNPLLIQRMGPFALGKKQRLAQSLSQPQLFVDIDGNAIRVVDATSNATTASAPLSQLTATPFTYRLGGGHLFPSAENAVSDAVGEYFSTMPSVAVRIPGADPLTLGCRDFAGLKRRFSWAGTVPVTNDPPAYAVSAADWRALTEKLGLARYLEDASQ